VILFIFVRELIEQDFKLPLSHGLSVKQRHFPLPETTTKETKRNSKKKHENKKRTNERIFYACNIRFSVFFFVSTRYFFFEEMKTKEQTPLMPLPRMHPEKDRLHILLLKQSKVKEEEEREIRTVNFL
jgi:hypothetical protein